MYFDFRDFLAHARGHVCSDCLLLPAALGLALILSMRPAPAESLNEVLLDHGLRASALPSGHAPDRPITGYAVLPEAALFAIAYYEDDGSGTVRPPLHVLRYDGITGRWRGAKITAADAGAEKRHCFGSAVSGHSTPHALFFTTHITPSASCTFVLSPDLHLRTVLYGWFLGSFADGAIVYHNSLVHFAPTRPARLSLYDPETGESRTIYPLRPYQPIREAHMARLRAVYDDPAWCGRRNHHCDPERFDNSIPGPVAIDDTTDSLAFVAFFSGADPAAEGNSPVPPMEVLYVYRNVSDADRIEYRELLPEDFRMRFGDLPVAGVLTLGILDQLFAD